MSAKETVCVAGLGGIGGSMASRLKERGWGVVGLDPDARRRTQWIGRTDRIAVGHPDALDWSTISHLVVAVRTERQVETVLGACAELGAQKLSVLVVSTVRVSFWKRTQELAPPPWRILECPVSGGEGPARQGTITMFVAGQCTVEDSALLDDLSDRIVTFPHHGTPAMMKLLNNTLAAINAANVARCLQIATVQGIDAQTFLDALEQGSGRSHMSTHLAEVSRNQFELLEKDVGLLLGDYPAASVGRDIVGLADLVQGGLGDLARPDSVL